MGNKGTSGGSMPGKSETRSQAPTTVHDREVRPFLDDFAAGDSHVVIRWRSKGTHRGPLANIPATGKAATNHGCTVMELKNTKVSRAWVYFDNAHLMRQLGVLPA
jgi:predicted ester cyclase